MLEQTLRFQLRRHQSGHLLLLGLPLEFVVSVYKLGKVELLVFLFTLSQFALLLELGLQLLLGEDFWQGGGLRLGQRVDPVLRNDPLHRDSFGLHVFT